MVQRRRREEPRRIKRRYIVLAILLALVVVGCWYGYRQFQLETAPVIQNSRGTTRPMDIPNADTKHFDNGFFAFDLPADWKLEQHTGSPYNLFSYKSTLTNADNRYLDIYADTIPQGMAVNMALAVKAQGAGLSHGQISENCTGFAPNAKATGAAKQLAIPAKWDGVEFICDNDSVTRNIVGTSSPAGVNRVTVTGTSGAAHAFFFVYFDKNYTPDYSILYKMLDSFSVK